MDKKIVLLFIAMYMLIFLSFIELSFVSAGVITQAGYSDCYQETANISTTCGGLALPNAYYFTSDNWVNKFNLFDGNNLTGSYINISSSNSTSLRIEYFKPNSALNTSKVNYFFKDDFGTVTKFQLNLTSDCWNYSNSYIQLLLTNTYNSSDTNSYNYSLWCFGQSETYNLLYNQSNPNYSPMMFTEESINWIVPNLIENSQTYRNLTYETAEENFILNVTYNPNSYPIINAYLNYNGTSYLGTKTGTGNNIIFNRYLNIDEITVEGENRTFYWTVELTNTTGTYYYNLTSYNQSIYSIGLDNCTIYNIKSINFTAYDQETLNRIFGFNFKGTFFYTIGNGTTYNNYSITMNNINETNICISGNLTYKITGSVQYSTDGYATTDYNFINYEISNLTKNISLYLLNLSSSTSFILKVQDNNQVPLSDYLIYIYRYDYGNPTPYLVQVTKTDSSGKTIGFFETEIVDYKFVITDSNGTIVYTSEKRKIIPETTPYTLIFTVGYSTPSPFIYYDNYTGIDYSLTFNKNTFLVTYIYTDSNNSFTNASLLVKYLNASNNQSVVCNMYFENPSGILTCDVGNYSGTYVAIAYINRGDTILVIDQIIFDIETFSRTLGMMGLLAGFFIILISAFLFAWNEVAGIVSVNIAVIFVNIMGFVNFGWIFITSMICISILILIIMERG